ncbi:hypothetical protein [Clostridium mediterraneense]|uniref:hypothetical protein n=1 Tax=Clostridium mediterraneense TaxID=1805472 RepID=UPI0008311B8A|nr:hypothetical protein [Clostridium mediterraneense]
MPNYYTYEEMDLDEAIKYLNDYYEKVKDTRDEKGYMTRLHGFITPEINSEKIDNLEAYKYTVIAKKWTNNDLRLDIFNDKKKSTTYLTTEQIKELKKFNDYLKQNDVKRYIKYQNIRVATVYLTIVLLTILWCLNNRA